jgi:hypothetical protein
MAVKLKIRPLIVFMVALILGLQGCSFAGSRRSIQLAVTSSSEDIPTWTPRPQDLTETALPTATRPAPIFSPTPIPRTATPTPPLIGTPKTVRVTIKGGNLFVHRGPSLDYNYVGVLYDGDTVLATGRDLVSRWVRVALPSKPGTDGWITTETKYTIIAGDISNLPFIDTEPAKPAYIRNCTKHELWVYPVGVQLLDKFEKPYNEERFSVGTYQIYDAENPENKPIQEVNVSEGRTVDIQYDWEGEKSKCE